MSRGWSVVVPEGYAVSRWQVGTPIATGSWGSVYEAWPGGPGTGPAPAAVKFIPTGTVTQRQLAHLADMARREREVYRRLRHPRLVQLIEAVVIDDTDHPDLDGAVALITERAKESLADVIDRADGHPVAGAPRILTQICEGLAHMHTTGWVHGDLKPGNVLIMADGSVRLADFGLSAELDGTHGYMPPAGSADYLPPEHWTELLTARGVAIRESADIWAFGVIACQLLAGHMPFSGPTARARAVAAAEYASSGTPEPRTGGLPPEWRRLITDCLAPDHATRCEMTAPRLLERLRRLRDEEAPVARDTLDTPDSRGGQGSPGRPADIPERMVRPPRRQGRWGRRRMAVAAAVSAAVATGSVLWVVSPWSPDYSRYFRAGTDIPAKYQSLIVKAGTMCPGEPDVSPALVAAILKAESGFNPRFSNPANHAFGIAGWTYRVLGPFSNPMEPSTAVPALGHYLCDWAPTLAKVPGDHGVNLAAAYQTSHTRVIQCHGVPPEIRGYAANVERYLREYQPAG